MQAAKLLAASGTASKLYAEDVFSAYTRTGTGASATVTTGIDMTQGYMLWTKGRSGATDHALYHSARGVTKDLVHNTTAAETTQATGLTAVSATGHTIGALAKMNTTSATYVDWVLRNADKFYNHTTVVKTGGSNATVSFANLTTLGMVRVKRTDSTGSWYIWHRSLTAGKLLIGETTAAEATLGHITVSGTTVTLVNGVIADGTYLVEGFAHDTATDGLIQCGSFTETGGVPQSVTLGWEPQYILVKTTTGTTSWYVYDTARGLVAGGTTSFASKLLSPNTSAAESSGGCEPAATGFKFTLGGTQTYIYLAIRRPNKPPTTGTQVYNAIARTGTGAAATVTGVGFAPDLAIYAERTQTYAYAGFQDRLRGALKEVLSSATSAETSATDSITSFVMDGFVVGTANATNRNAQSYINHFFKRSVGCFDIVCYTGTGSATTVSHGLGAVPELMIVRNRPNPGSQWVVYSAALANTEHLLLSSTAAKATVTTYWNSTTPTSSSFTVGTASDVNQSATAHVAYLFATLAGISKVFSYTGNGGTAGSAGTSQTINCGFTTGARFVMLKCTSHTSDWVIVDTVRGLIAGSDPALSLNTTAAEVTTTDLLDPDTSGFIVNQLATGTTSADFNVTGRSYIGIAFS